MSHRKTDNFEVGQDSFLDTTANLVGILIILVVIVGASTQKTVTQLIIEQISEEQTAALNDTVDRAMQTHEQVNRQKQVMAEQEFELAYRDRERDAFLQKLHQAELEYAERLAELDSPDQKSIEQQSTIRELKKELSELENSIGELDDAEPETELLQHLPTPKAKTVFGKEVHIMLANGRVSFIPWDELVEQLKEEASRVAQRIGGNSDADSTLGPIGGFVMNYRLKSRSGVLSNGQTSGLGQVVELDRFELEPTSQLIAETVDEALQGGGRLGAELSVRRPRDTVITVWVYPDSFDAFRSLKEKLYEMGFLTAARPLPEGVRIGASPNGSKSAAQ